MAAGGGIHAAGEGRRGYLLLHSAFGPSSTQLREKTEPGRGGETQNTGEEAVKRARALRWAGEERQAERLGAGPAPQGAPSCPPVTAAAPGGATDVSLPRGAQRAGWGTHPPLFLQPGTQSLGLCGQGL